LGDSVLLLSYGLTSGGTERQLVEIAKALALRGWDVHVGCFHDTGSRANELRAAGIPIVRLPVTSFRSARSLAAGFSVLRRYIREHNIRLSHSFDPPLSMFGAIAARLAGCPVVLTSQRSYRKLVGRAEQMLLRVSDRVSDGVVVNCEAMRRHLMEDVGIRPERIRLCYNGLDAARFFPARGNPQPEVLRGSVVVGTLCVLRPEKDLGVLLQGFATALKRRPAMKLLIVGSGPSRDELVALAAGLGLREHVVFEPDTTDVPLWLNRMDIFVLPSRSEAFSNSIMEAMACGAAVIASRVGGNPELIPHGERGLLFERGNAEELAAHIVTLAGDAELRAAYASRSIEFVRTRLTLQAAADQMESIYREYLDGRPVSVTSRPMPPVPQSIRRPDQ
jgi:L-malate glycosyltransferase